MPTKMQVSVLVVIALLGVPHTQVNSELVPLNRRLGSPYIARHLEACSLGDGMVYCEAIDSCKDYSIQGCTVTCQASGACERADIENSSILCQEKQSCKSATVEDTAIACSGSESCEYSKMYRSTVACSAGDACRKVDFYASAVTISRKDAIGSFFLSSLATFNQCSCCAGQYCLRGVPKCLANGAPSEEFCFSQVAGITCAALGNPTCKEMPGYRTAVPNAEVSTTTAPLVEGSTTTVSVEITVQYDDFANKTNWRLFNQNGTILAGKEAGFGEPNQTDIASLDLPCGLHTFVIEDSRNSELQGEGAGYTITVDGGNTTVQGMAGNSTFETFGVCPGDLAQTPVAPEANSSVFGGDMLLSEASPATVNRDSFP